MHTNRRHRRGGATRRETEKVLTDLVKRVHDGDYRSPERITLGEYLTERWIPLRKSQVRLSTWESFRRTINLHVLPHIGNIPMEKLTPEDLDSLYGYLLTEGRKNGDRGGLSPKTVRNLHNLLHKALADAVRKGRITRNVADMADPPKPRQTSSMQVWDAEQLRQFLTEIDDHPLASAFYLAANTGMRRGEVLGIQWQDVDVDAARLSVHRSVLNIAYAKTVDDVKSSSGRRSIDLDERTVAVLREWRRTQRAEMKLVGRQATNDDMVFARPDGTPVHPDYFSQCFQRHLAKSDLPRIRFHDLRHTHATILLKANVPVKVVSERLGHSSPAFTMTVYQHVLPGMQAEAAAKFSEAVFGTAPQDRPLSTARPIS